MTLGTWAWAAAMLWASVAWGQATAVQAPVDPYRPLSLQQQQWESVYAPPTAVTEEEGLNAGGVHTDLSVAYLTDYIFRGIDRFDAALGSEDAANLQSQGLLTFDLGKLPHPFIGLFSNVAESDVISNFQEIRPFVGAEWTLRPLILSGGHTTYLFPNRPNIETSEVFGKIQLDDSYFLRSDEPLLSPYVYAAYDYDLYSGWYIEGGVEHAFKIEETGITLTLQASVAYVRGMELFIADGGRDGGFQHYQIGMIGSYSLNNLFNFSRRYGEWTFRGYVFYTDGISDKLRADTELWGGAGIGFSY